MISWLVLLSQLQVVISSHECDVKWMSNVCDCDAWTSKGTTVPARVCSECKNPLKWGYSCDLDCTDTCGEDGCDQEGNCRQQHCKEDSRSPFPELREGVQPERNRFLTCQACDDGWFGLHCTQQCNVGNPGKYHHCKKSTKQGGSVPEGSCTRTGMCYECEDGWYGETCELKCPGNCKKCAMKDRMVLANPSSSSLLETNSSARKSRRASDKEDETDDEDYKPGGEGLDDFDFGEDEFPDDFDDDGNEYLPAGACLEQCDGDFWGTTCDKACPSTCKKYKHKASCDKVTGDCHKCGSRKGTKHIHQWWGPTCDNLCGPGCYKTMCFKANGVCEQGVIEGYCKNDGHTECPQYTVGGCDKETCLPNGCSEGRFPGFLDNGSPSCIGCSENCKDGQCNEKGECSTGCTDGWYGRFCDHQCSPGCDGNCAQATGQCEKCKGGLTGADCSDQCHSSCLLCKQFRSMLFNYAGNTADSCTACPRDKPTELRGSECVCIDGAEPDESAPKGSNECKCSDPDEAGLMTAFFINTPSKRCRTKCIADHIQAYADMSATCIHKDTWAAVFHLSLAAEKDGKNIPEGKQAGGNCQDFQTHVCIAKTPEGKFDKNSCFQSLVTINEETGEVEGGPSGDPAKYTCIETKYIQYITEGGR